MALNVIMKPIRAGESLCPEKNIFHRAMYVMGLPARGSKTGNPQLQFLHHTPAFAIVFGLALRAKVDQHRAMGRANPTTSREDWVRVNYN
jgi:hypothetical protein